MRNNTDLYLQPFRMYGIASVTKLFKENLSQEMHFSHFCSVQAPFNSVSRYRRKDSFEANPLCSLSLFCDRNFSSLLVYSFFCFLSTFICETTFRVRCLNILYTCTTLCNTVQHCTTLWNTVQHCATLYLLPCTSLCSTLSRSPHTSQSHLSLQIYLNVSFVFTPRPSPPKPLPLQISLRYNDPSRDMIPYTDRSW
jgi:hypothetical protein